MKKFYIVFISIFTLGLFGCLTSDDSTDEEIKSSSSEEVKYSSEDDDTGDVKNKEGCFEEFVIIDSLVTYSWIDEYSDGKKDTVFQSLTYNSWETSNVEGSTEMVEKTICTGGMPPPPYELIKRIEVCPMDSLYHWKDSSTTPRLTEIIDTLYLNYTEDAVDKKVKPTIEFANEEEILAAMDTLYYGVSGQGIVPILKHLKNDDADFKIEFITDVNDSIIQIEYFSDYECGKNEYETFDPCKEKNRCLYMADACGSKALETNYIPNIEGDELKWRLIATSRLGYVDTLEITSKLVTAECSDQEK